MYAACRGYVAKKFSKLNEMEREESHFVRDMVQMKNDDIDAGGADDESSAANIFAQQHKQMVESRLDQTKHHFEIAAVNDIFKNCYNQKMLAEREHEDVEEEKEPFESRSKPDTADTKEDTWLTDPVKKEQKVAEISGEEAMEMVRRVDPTELDEEDREFHAMFHEFSSDSYIELFIKYMVMVGKKQLPNQRSS